MSVVTAGSGFGVVVCKAIGLDPTLVRNMAIEIPADGFVYLDVQMLVTVDQAQEIKKELEAKKIVVNIICEKK
jgi:hypothetical protein